MPRVRDPPLPLPDPHFLRPPPLLLWLFFVFFFCPLVPSPCFLFFPNPVLPKPWRAITPGSLLNPFLDSLDLSKVFPSPPFRQLFFGYFGSPGMTPESHKVPPCVLFLPPPCDPYVSFYNRRGASSFRFSPPPWATRGSLQFCPRVKPKTLVPRSKTTSVSIVLLPQDPPATQVAVFGKVRPLAPFPLTCLISC